MYTKNVLSFAPVPDVLILGAGPAALILAAACAEKGLVVQGVAPEPMAPWVPRYGAWADELPPIFSEAVAHTWARASAHTPHRVVLERPYVCLSTPRLQALLAARCAAVSWVAGRARSVQHTPAESAVRLADGRLLRARVVVDATGRGAFLSHAEAPGAWQTAAGLLITTRSCHPWPLDEIGLMDFRGTDGLPSFLYAQPLGPRRVFVEETALIRRPEVPIPALKERLLARLAGLGVEIAAIEDEERCRIQMIGPQPIIGQRVVGFGASGGMVHPASGYLLARLPAAADAVAAALAAGLSRGPEPASREAWAALWPAERQRQWAIYRFGARLLCQLDADETRRFFTAFFSISPSLWSGFLSATLPPLGLARAMAAVFVAASLSTRLQLLSAGTSGSGLDLLRQLLSHPRPDL